jgi:hypothetical protein
MAASLTVTPRAGTVLELTPDEAKCLYDILQLIGGTPSTTRRRHADRIQSALREGGVIPRKPEWAVIPDIDPLRCSIYFLEGTNP